MLRLWNWARLVAFGSSKYEMLRELGCLYEDAVHSMNLSFLRKKEPDCPSTVRASTKKLDYGQIAHQSHVLKSMSSHYRRRMSHWFPRISLIHMIFRRTHRVRLYHLHSRPLLPHFSFLARAIFRRTQSGLLYGSQSLLFVRWFLCQHIKCQLYPNSAITLMMREPSMNLNSPSA